jgi:aminoglycoside phosphotransferase (APT) family kinase protein
VRSHGRHRGLAVTVDGIGEWERDHLSQLASVEAMWTELAVGDTLLHFDPRFDNILISPCGTAHLVDWGRACIGPIWGDLVCLLLQSDLGDVDPEEIFAGHPVGEAAEPKQAATHPVAVRCQDSVVTVGHALTSWKAPHLTRSVGPAALRACSKVGSPGSAEWARWVSILTCPENTGSSHSLPGRP